MNLSQIAAEFKAHFEAVETEAQKYLAEHIPGVLDIAQKVESDPLVQAVLAASLPAPVRQMIAELVTKLDAEYPKPPAPVDPAMGQEPAQPA